MNTPQEEAGALGEESPPTLADLLEHMTVLTLRPNDVIVIKSSRLLSAQAAGHIAQLARDAFGGAKVIVLDDDMTIGIVRGEAD